MKSIAEYSGRLPRMDDPLARAAHARDMAVSGRFYGPGTADWDQKMAQVALNPQTAESLYSESPLLRGDYRSGSRPALERLLARVVRPEMTDRQRAFAILSYCHYGFLRDYPPILPKGLTVLNASEEEILKLGGGQCEDRSRLIICLMQIAAIPARFVASSTWFDPDAGYADHGGHAIVEFYVERGWGFADSLHDFYCVCPNGKLASLWDLIQSPDLPVNQPEHIYAECGKERGWDVERTREWFRWYRDEYLRPNHLITLAKYSASDFGRYDWDWSVLDERPGAPEAETFWVWAEEQKRKALAEAGIALDPRHRAG